MSARVSGRLFAAMAFLGAICVAFAYATTRTTPERPDEKRHAPQRQADVEAELEATVEAEMALAEADAELAHAVALHDTDPDAAVAALAAAGNRR